MNCEPAREGVEIQGTSFAHGIRVDGTVRGTIRSKPVSYRTQGRVEAELAFAGHDQWRVSRRHPRIERVEIQKEGRVYGISLPMPDYRSRCPFRGKCNMHESKSEQPRLPDRVALLHRLKQGTVKVTENKRLTEMVRVPLSRQAERAQPDPVWIASRNPIIERPGRFETADDAGVYRLDDSRALVQTLDFFSPW